MYKLNIIKAIIFIFFSIFFNGCAQKTTIKTLKPSQVSDKSMKNISIDKFSNDTISLSANIHSYMNNVIFNDKKYFNIVNREDTNRILDEFAIKDSGLVDIKDEESFALADVNSIVTGKINSTNYSVQPFFIYRTNYSRCKDYTVSKNGKRYCARYQKYTVVCHNHQYNVDATIKITKVMDASVLYNNNFNLTKSIETCMDSSKVTPQSSVVYKQISQQIAQQFISKISPSYQYFNVVLIEDEDIDYNSKQEQLLENGLKMVELNNMQGANNVFKMLVSSTSSQSSTALYNLAITEESLGNLEVAFELYKKAEDITLRYEIDENITKAVQRVRLTLRDKQKAMVQINN